jgi:hypothetical protein
MTDTHATVGANLRKPKILFLTISLIALVIFLAWPTTNAQSPFWEVWVVNEANQPIEGMTVTLIYQNYSAESEEHSEQKQTDALGYVAFPPQNLKVSRLHRIATTVQSARAGVHASFGPHAWVMASGDGLDGTAVSNGYVTDWNGAPARMASRVVVKPRP